MKKPLSKPKDSDADCIWGSLEKIDATAALVRPRNRLGVSAQTFGRETRCGERGDTALAVKL